MHYITRTDDVTWYYYKMYDDEKPLLLHVDRIGEAGESAEKYVEKEKKDGYTFTIRTLGLHDAGEYCVFCNENSISACLPVTVHVRQLKPFFSFNRTIPELNCSECLLGWMYQDAYVECVIGTQNEDEGPMQVKYQT